MEIPDLKISCLRCFTEALLEPGAIQKDAGGAYRPINVKRPDGWIAGPAPVSEVEKGLCSRCVPDWNALQNTFLATPPTDEAIEVRPYKDHSIPAQKQAPTMVKVAPRFDTSIPDRGVFAAAPRVTSTPVIAPAPEAPQTVMPAAPPPVVHMAPLHMRGVTMAPTARVIPASPAPGRTYGTTHAAPLPSRFGTAVAVPISTPGMAVKVTSQPISSIGVAPTSMQKMAPAAAPIAMAPIGMTPTQQNTYHVTKIQKGVVPVGGQVSAPVPIAGMQGHLPSQGGVVTTSAPMPLRLSTPTEDGGSQQGIVTISAPQPIAKEKT